MKMNISIKHGLRYTDREEDDLLVYIVTYIRLGIGQA